MIERSGPATAQATAGREGARISADRSGRPGQLGAVLPGDDEHLPAEPGDLGRDGARRQPADLDGSGQQVRHGVEGVLRLEA